MQYFKYQRFDNATIAHQILDTVKGMEGFAKSKYKSHYQEAMEETTNFLLKNFDPAYGDLHSYAMSVMGTILLNKFNRESTNEIQYELSVTQQSMKDVERSSPEYILTEGIDDRIDDFDSCVSYLIPNFILDYEVWKKGESYKSHRRGNYAGIFSLYKPLVIDAAVDYLTRNHYEDMVYLNKLTKTVDMRRYSKDRYMKSMDETVQFLAHVGNTVVVKIQSRRLRRYMYYFDMKEVVRELVEAFYSEGCVACRRVHKSWVYCTFSGRLVDNLDILKEEIESEIVGSIFVRSNTLKCVYYKPGADLFVSSTTEDECGLTYELFGQELVLKPARLSVKKILGDEEGLEDCNQVDHV